MDRIEPPATVARAREGGDAMRMLQLSITGVVLLLLLTSAAGCRFLLSEDDPMVLPTRDVVVAALVIEQGTNIEPEMLTLRSVPLDDTNAMAFEDPASAVGKVAAVDIPPFQMITPNLLVAE